jgi:hypothetical protein
MAALLAVAASAPGSGARAQTPPEALVWYVLDAINGLHFDIEDPMNRPPLVLQVPDGVLTAIDISHDGQADWRIDWPQDIAFCGTGGCRRTLYVSTDDGFVRAFDRRASDLALSPAGDAIRLEAGLHSLYCRDERVDCRFSWTWDRAASRFVPDGEQPGDPPPPVDRPEID